MQIYSVRIKPVFFIFLLIILATGQACTSKRLAKQASNLEDAGLYEMAAEHYLKSFRSNQRNIEAATGLRRTAQRTLESRAIMVNQAWLEGDDRETVYRYLEVLDYHQKIGSAGIQLSIPGQARTNYQEAKPRFLDNTFEEARLLLEEERFNRAESLFLEINRIDPDYQDLSRYMRVSRSEPLYRTGTDQLNSGFYRRAYQTFTTLLNNHGAYKDARELREDALKKGRLTVAIADFENRTRQRNIHELIKSRITAELSSGSNPFIQVVDDRNINAFLKEQQMAARLGSEMKVGHLMAAKALLTGELTSFEIREGRLQQTEKRAYLKEEIEIVDGVTREKTTRTVYHKVTYVEYSRENSASGSFRYQLSSTETGAILASGVIELSPSDKVNYAVFDGEPDKLVPGHWEERNRDSPKDNIRDEARHIRPLQNLLSARQEIRPAGSLRNELAEGIASAVSQAVNDHNPEQ